MQLPLALTLEPSRRLGLMLLAAHGGALTILVEISAPGWMRLILLLLICCSFGLIRQRTHGGNRIASLLLRADGTLEYVRKNGQTGETQVHPDSTVTPQLTVVLLRLNKRLEALVLLPDSLPEEHFRQLRLWLRRQADAGLA